MAINKVVYGSETLIDLTEDTATAADVAQGKTFHLASGAQATGTSRTLPTGGTLGQVVTPNNSTSTEISWQYTDVALCSGYEAQGESDGFLFFHNGDGVFPSALPQASTVTKGTVKVGSGLSIASDGTLSATGGGGGAQTTWYGTLSTNASTAAKVVECEGFELVEGAIIGIYARTGNSAGSPTLNINSTGAKQIYVGSAVASNSNPLKWATYTMLYFMYDGSRYRYITSATTPGINRVEGAGCWYGTCGTNASTATKLVTITGYRPADGTIVSIKFSAANTVAGAVNLNISSTGIWRMYVNGAMTDSSNPLLWDAGETLTFMYTNSGYHLIARDQMPAATSSTLGGVKVGSGLSVASDGTLSATGGGGGSAAWADVLDDITSIDDIAVPITAYSNGSVMLLCLNLTGYIDGDLGVVLDNSVGTFLQGYMADMYIADGTGAMILCEAHTDSTNTTTLLLAVDSGAYNPENTYIVNLTVPIVSS